jgi:hypothetical protein
MELANEAYFTVESQIKKLNDIVDFLQKELKSAKQTESGNINVVSKQLQELVNFENFLNSITF